jgi:hypothetical protein
MRKLIHVVRGSDRGYDFHLLRQNGEPAPLRRHVSALLPRELNVERSDFSKEVEFAMVDARDADVAIEALATANPGCEIRVYSLEQVGQCPAAPLVLKKVDESGVLPS